MRHHPVRGTPAGRRTWTAPRQCPLAASERGIWCLLAPRRPPGASALYICHLGSWPVAFLHLQRGTLAQSK
jgi:hypothetical protein